MKFILIILDGFGLREEERGNAYALGNTPHLDNLLNNKPMAAVETSGRHVGLPDGIMGNSEVGHMNIGAGRIVKQDLVRINDDIRKDVLKTNPQLNASFKHALDNNSTLHLFGLMSDGGVHSHIDHFKYVIEAAKAKGIQKISIHPFMDGRDTSPTSGIRYIAELQLFLNDMGLGQIATICGRYYAMDRDNRWDRVRKAYDMLVEGKGDCYDSANDAMEATYAENVTDEFMLPKIIGDVQPISDGDAVISMNYRADRMRQISRAFTEDGFNEFPVKALNIHYTSMTQYQESFTFSTLYPPVRLNQIFPEILSHMGFNQLRIAETEKYAHVTYFFNGGDENQFPGEDRILIPSPKVATYDLKPEMSARELTLQLLEALESGKYEAIIVNYANPDMVGHTGILQAAIDAVETIDECVGKVVAASKAEGAGVFLTADHGNLEMMIDPDTGQPHTAHTTLPVPFVLDCQDESLSLQKTGKLADIAPTILSYLGISQPVEMSGKNLLIRTGF